MVRSNHGFWGSDLLGGSLVVHIYPRLRGPYMHNVMRYLYFEHMWIVFCKVSFEMPFDLSENL
jgi:hypothetical protein